MFSFPISDVLARAVLHSIRENAAAHDWVWETDAHDGVTLGLNDGVSITIEISSDKAGGFTWAAACDLLDATWLVERSGEAATFQLAQTASTGAAILAQLTAFLYVMTGQDESRMAAEHYLALDSEPTNDVEGATGIAATQSAVMMGGDISGTTCHSCGQPLRDKTFYTKESITVCEECA